MWVLSVLLFHIPSPLRAELPTEQIQFTVDKVLTILRNPGPKPLGKEHRDKLRQIISARFDFTEMANRPLGLHRRRGTPEEQREFVRLFTDLLEDSYLGKIQSYVGARFIYLDESPDGDFSEVAAKIVAMNGEEFAINYKLRSADGSCKIYDLVIENVSLVNNSRAQFNRILTTAPFGELLNRLQQRRVKEFGSERMRLNTIASYSILCAGFLARPR